jgi:hypothetical protein
MIDETSTHTELGGVYNDTYKNFIRLLEEKGYIKKEAYA